MSEAATAEPDLHEPTLAEEVAQLGDEGRFEFVNLREEDTGIAGVLFVSTELVGHGPRIKYYTKTGKRQPSFSVSIAAEPCLLASSLPPHYVNRAGPQVIEWVRLNHQPLLRLWYNGEDWDFRQLTAFMAELKPL